MRFTDHKHWFWGEMYCIFVGESCAVCIQHRGGGSHGGEAATYREGASEGIQGTKELGKLGSGLLQRKAGGGKVVPGSDSGPEPHSWQSCSGGGDSEKESIHLTKGHYPSRPLLPGVAPWPGDGQTWLD